MRILMPLPSRDFDPTEVSIPWKIFSERGHTVAFATPDGRPGTADPRMVTGEGLGPWRWILRARRDAREAYRALQSDERFEAPVSYEAIEPGDYDGIVLAGGHAPGMRTYLESERLHELVGRWMHEERPLAAICHGVVVVARARDPETGDSTLRGRRTTALPESMEMSAWQMTRWWLGDYYRTYPQTVQQEVTEATGSPELFEEGPSSILRDSPAHLDRGFVVRDGAYLSGRWPGDAHRLATTFLAMLEE
jgi:putative intracellular protease/amidase